MAVIPQATSTRFNPVYAFSQFIPTVDTDYNGDIITPSFDIFSPKIINAINAIQVTTYNTYVGGPITTLANNSYQNTTCWWMLAMASGILHPLRILLGSWLNLPRIDLIVNSLDQAQTASSRNINTVVI